MIGGCCPRTGGLLGSYWPPPPIRTHWPFQSGKLALSCDHAPVPAAHNAATNAIDAVKPRSIMASSLQLLLPTANTPNGENHGAAAATLVLKITPLGARRGRGRSSPDNSIV